MTNKLFRVWDAKNNCIKKQHKDDPRLPLVDQIGEIIWVDLRGTPRILPSHYVLDFSTGFCDRDGIHVFQNDLVEFTHSYWTKASDTPETIAAVVTWDQAIGAWTLVNTQNSQFRVLLSKHIKNGKVVGRKG